MKKDWVYSTIEDCCNVNYGTRVVRSKVSGDEYPVYGGGGETFRMNEYNRENCVVVSRFAMSKLCTRIVTGKFFLNDSGLTVSPKPSAGLLPSLLDRYLLASNDTIYSFGRGSAQRNLNMAEFRKMRIAYPVSLAEQQAIVAHLDVAFAKIDELRSNAEHELQAAKDMFQAALRDCFTSGTDWFYSSIEDCCNVNYGTRVVRSKVSGDEYPVYGGGGETFRMNEYNRENCVVVSRFAMSKLCTRIVTGKFFLNDSGLTVSPKPSSGLLSSLLDRYLLASNDTIYAFGRGSAQRNLNMAEFKKMRIAYPASLAEQQAIVAKLDAISERCHQLEDNYTRISRECDALKQSLLRQIFE